MKNITIISATGSYQSATIDNKDYEFDFNHQDLTKSIHNNLYTHELEDRTGLSYSDNTSYEMAFILAEDWDYSDVQQLISDFITDNPNNLIDHLITA